VGCLSSSFLNPDEGRRVFPLPFPWKGSAPPPPPPFPAGEGEDFSSGRGGGEVFVFSLGLSPIWAFPFFFWGGFFLERWARPLPPLFLVRRPVQFFFFFFFPFLRTSKGRPPFVRSPHFFRTGGGGWLGGCPPLYRPTLTRLERPHFSSSFSDRFFFFYQPSPEAPRGGFFFPFLRRGLL